MSVAKVTVNGLVLAGAAEEDASGWDMVRPPYKSVSHWSEGDPQ